MSVKRHGKKKGVKSFADRERIDRNKFTLLALIYLQDQKYDKEKLDDIKKSYGPAGVIDGCCPFHI